MAHACRALGLDSLELTVLWWEMIMTTGVT